MITKGGVRRRSRGRCGSMAGGPRAVRRGRAGPPLRPGGVTSCTPIGVPASAWIPAGTEMAGQPSDVPRRRVGRVAHVGPHRPRPPTAPPRLGRDGWGGERRGEQHVVATEVRLRVRDPGPLLVVLHLVEAPDHVAEPGVDPRPALHRPAVQPVRLEGRTAEPADEARHGVERVRGTAPPRPCARPRPGPPPPAGLRRPTPRRAGRRPPADAATSRSAGAGPEDVRRRSRDARPAPRTRARRQRPWWRERRSRSCRTSRWVRLLRGRRRSPA